MPLSGLLILNKPLRMSSAQAVAIVKRCADGEKVGHAGTLDPLATGVLVLAIGKATKSIDKLMATSKRYRTQIDLSAFTTTDDGEGTRTEVEVASPPSIDSIRAMLASRFTGEIMQRPPAFSAVKVGGRRAYAIARGGGEPKIAERPVIVHEIAVANYQWPIAEIEIQCGKGFYVRRLARDLGTALGTGGCCASIRRTAIGTFTIEQARTIEQLPPRLVQDDLLPVA